MIPRVDHRDDPLGAPSIKLNWIENTRLLATMQNRPRSVKTMRNFCPSPTHQRPQLPLEQLGIMSGQAEGKGLSEESREEVQKQEETEDVALVD